MVYFTISAASICNIDGPHGVGFLVIPQVVHDLYGTVLEVNNTGSSRHLWYSAELALPYDLGSIDNPVFAVYPGGNWDNETFQKIAVITGTLCVCRFLSSNYRHAMN